MAQQSQNFFSGRWSPFRNWEALNNSKSLPSPNGSTYETTSTPQSSDVSQCTFGSRDRSTTTSDRSIPMVMSGVVPIPGSLIEQEVLTAERVQLERERLHLELERQRLERATEQLETTSQKLKHESDQLQTEREEMHRIQAEGERLRARKQRMRRRRRRCLALLGTLFILLCLGAGATVYCWRWGQCSFFSSRNDFSVEGNATRSPLPGPSPNLVPLPPATPIPTMAPASWRPTTRPINFELNFSLEPRPDKVVLSDDGKIMAVALFFQVKVYRLAEEKEQGLIHSKIVRTGCADATVALSKDGLTMAIGCPESAVGELANAGKVSVLEYDQAIDDYIPKGQPLFGTAKNANAGSAIALNDSGTILAVGAPIDSSPGEVVVYEFVTGAFGWWATLGSTIKGNSVDDKFGSTVSLTDAMFGWLTVVVGSSGGNTTVVDASLHAFQLNEQRSWKLLGDRWGDNSLRALSNQQPLFLHLVVTKSQTYRLVAGRKGSTKVYDYDRLSWTWKIVDSVHIPGSSAGKLLNQGETLVVGTAAGESNGEAASVLMYEFDASASSFQATCGQQCLTGELMDACTRRSDSRIVLVTRTSLGTNVWEELGR